MQFIMKLPMKATVFLVSVAFPRVPWFDITQIISHFRPASWLTGEITQKTSASTSTAITAGRPSLTVVVMTTGTMLRPEPSFMWEEGWRCMLEITIIEWPVSVEDNILLSLDILFMLTKMHSYTLIQTHTHTLTYWHTDKVRDDLHQKYQWRFFMVGSTLLSLNILSMRTRIHTYTHIHIHWHIDTRIKSR